MVSDCLVLDGLFGIKAHRLYMLHIPSFFNCYLFVSVKQMPFVLSLYRDRVS